MNRKVIVFGGSGKTGQCLLAELVKRKIHTSAFVRRGSVAKITIPTLPVFEGDVLDSNEVNKVFIKEKFTDVVIALGSKDLKATMIRSKGTQNIIDALKWNDSKVHLHVLSALGIRESWSQLQWYNKLISNWLIKPTMNDHTAQEECAVGSGLPFHITRPVALKDSARTEKIHKQNEGFLPRNSISRADVAWFMVNGIETETHGVSSICSGS